MVDGIWDCAIWAGRHVGSFIYDYQTLITGFMAIGAAWYAGAPVWRQLKDSNLQTRIQHRETLTLMLREAEERAARVAEAIDERISKAQDATSDPEAEPIAIDAPTAHHLEQMLDGRLDWYLVTLAGTEDPRIEERKRELAGALKDLTGTLSDVHWPAHNDQSGEDYALSDEVWADVLRKANEGKTLAADRVSATWKANQALKEAQKFVVDELRGQIAQLDRQITRIA